MRTKLIFHPKPDTLKHKYFFNGRIYHEVKLDQFNGMWSKCGAINPIEWANEYAPDGVKTWLYLTDIRDVTIRIYKPCKRCFPPMKDC